MDQFFTTNSAIVASVSGQTFFVVGLLSGWEFRRYSKLPLARPLWMLSVFGLLYALAEWGRLFIPIQERYLSSAVTESLWLVRLILMAMAFAALLQFGIELLPPWFRRRLRIVPPVIFIIWVCLLVCNGWVLREVIAATMASEIQARVLLALPAGLVGAVGLFTQARYLQPVGGIVLVRWAQLTGIAAGVTGLTLGLMLPATSDWAGTDSLLDAPSELWRALAGILLAIGTARTLQVFQLEQDRAVEEAEHRAIQAQTHDHIARELSDGVLQRLYAVGLLIGSTANQLPPDDPIHLALRELDESIEALRAMLLDRPPPP